MRQPRSPQSEKTPIMAASTTSTALIKKRSIFDAIKDASVVEMESLVRQGTDINAAADSTDADKNKFTPLQFAANAGKRLRCHEQSRCWDYDQMSMTVDDHSGCCRDESVQQCQSGYTAYTIQTGFIAWFARNIAFGSTATGQGDCVHTLCCIPSSEAPQGYNITNVTTPVIRQDESMAPFHPDVVSPFVALYKGTVEVPAEGVYTFYLGSRHSSL